MVGVNGAGKTTTIGKLAHRYKQQGLSVMLAAGDTFRAAAVEHQAWGSAMMSLLLPSTPVRIARRCTTPLRRSGTQCRHIDRRHCRATAEQISRMDGSPGGARDAKQDETVPHETLLVLGGNGQNSVSQAVGL